MPVWVAGSSLQGGSYRRRPPPFVCVRAAKPATRAAIALPAAATVPSTLATTAALTANTAIAACAGRRLRPAAAAATRASRRVRSTSAAPTCAARMHSGQARLLDWVRAWRARLHRRRLLTAAAAAACAGCRLLSSLTAFACFASLPSGLGTAATATLATASPSKRPPAFAIHALVASLLQPQSGCCPFPHSGRFSKRHSGP